MADIYITYGTDLAAITHELMGEAGVAARLRADTRVAIKPNLVVARPADDGATTHPQIVEGILRFVRDAGVRDITILEGSWLGEGTQRAFSACGYTALAERYGARLLDTKRDKTVACKSHGLDLEICESALRAEFLINVPVLKGHCQTSMTCCLKNLKGCIPDREKRRFHTLGLHRPIAALAAALRPALHIVDGVCGDLTFEEGGNPVQAGRVLLGRDPVLLDSYGAHLMGYQPEEIDYIPLAARCGAGQLYSPATTVHELHAQERPPLTAPRSSLAKDLARYTQPDSACSACYAALIFALHKSGYRGPRVAIGQGYRGKAAPLPGVGQCTALCARHLPGCPPKASDIVRFLTEE